jgi:shikimate kinase
LIVLVGFMGAGKSTVGRALASRVGLPFVDSDHVIERATGRTVREIFAADGESAFRQLERETVAQLLQGPEAVLALGGGAVEHPATRAALAAVPVVFLQVDLADALARTGADARRPVLRRPDLPDLFEHRQVAYQEVASFVVPTGGRTVEQLASDILGEFAALLASAEADDGAGDEAGDGAGADRAIDQSGRAGPALRPRTAGASPGRRRSPPQPRPT